LLASLKKSRTLVGIGLAASIAILGVIPVSASVVTLAPNPAAIDVSAGADSISDLSVKVSRDGTKAAAIWITQDFGSPQLQFSSAVFNSDTGYWDWAEPQTISNPADTVQQLGNLSNPNPSPNLAISDDGLRVLVTWAVNFDRTDWDDPEFADAYNDIDWNADDAMDQEYGLTNAGTEVFVLSGSFSNGDYTFAAPTLVAQTDEYRRLGPADVAMSADGNHALVVWRDRQYHPVRKGSGTLMGKAAVLTNGVFDWDSTATKISLDDQVRELTEINDGTRAEWSTVLAIGSTGVSGGAGYAVSALASWQSEDGRVFVANANLDNGRLSWGNSITELGVKAAFSPCLEANIASEETNNVSLAMTSSSTQPIRAVIAYNQSGVGSSNTQACAGTFVQEAVADAAGEITLNPLAKTQVLLFGTSRPNISLSSDGSRVLIAKGEVAVSGKFRSDGVIDWDKDSDDRLIQTDINGDVSTQDPIPEGTASSFIAVASATDSSETTVVWRRATGKRPSDDVFVNVKTLHLATGNYADGVLSWSASQEFPSATPSTDSFNAEDQLQSLSVSSSGDGSRVAIVWIGFLGGKVTVRSFGPDVTSPTIISPNTEPEVTVGTIEIETYTADEQVLWSITGGEDQDSFSIGEMTGVLELVAELPSGEYTVEISATDGSGNSTSVTVTVTVVPDPLAGLKTQYQVASGETFVVSLKLEGFFDWYIDGGRDESIFDGDYPFKSDNDYSTMDLFFKSPPQDGEYVVIVYAGDQEWEYYPKQLTITVGAIVDTTNPTIVSPDLTPSVDQGDLVVGRYVADENVSWSIAGGDDSLLFEIDSESGELRFKKQEPAGSYQVRISATDDFDNSSSVTITVTVNGEGDTGDGESGDGDSAVGENETLVDPTPSSSGAQPSIDLPLGSVEATSGGELELVGRNLDSVTRAEIDAKDAQIRAKNQTSLKLGLPQLAIGTYDLTLTASFGRLSISDAVRIVSGSAVLTPEAEGRFNAWTKLNAPKTQVRVYAKNLIGVGKVQFFVNGREVAWVRAVDETDPKLRRNGDWFYLIRRVELVRPKNVFEIYLNGERVWRAAYRGN
jgi:hypothetical protein